MKDEIHFYTDITDETQVSEKDLDTMLVDYKSTKIAINSATIFSDVKPRIIKTTQLSFLTDSWSYIKAGFKVYFYIKSKQFEVKEHMKCPTGKDIIKGHNIHKLLLGETFGKL